MYSNTTHKRDVIKILNANYVCSDKHMGGKIHRCAFDLIIQIKNPFTSSSLFLSMLFETCILLTKTTFQLPREILEYRRNVICGHIPKWLR